MAESFNAAVYVRAPIITVQSGIALARALHDACPDDAPESVIRACKHLKKTADRASGTLAERNRILGKEVDTDGRPLDNEADRCWGALQMRLQALAMLPAETYPRAERAATLEKQLFAAGTGFLKSDYETQSGAMSGLLKRIQQDKLADEINDLAGPEFLRAVRDVQPRYEAMVSERLRRNKIADASLVEMVRTLQTAIVGYARKVVAGVEDEVPATVEAARLALLPIDNFRAGSAARARRADEGEPADGGGETPGDEEPQAEDGEDLHAQDDEAEPGPAVAKVAADRKPKLPAVPTKLVATAAPKANGKRK